MPGSRRDLTAMARSEASRPLRIAVEHGIVTGKHSYLDYGCGRGADVDWLLSLGYRARGWDPVHRPETKKSRTETVGLTYVVNVIEDPLERVRVLTDAWKLATGVLVVSARLLEERDASHIKPRADGWMTARGTFQKFYEHHELGEWISGVLGVEPISAAPGVFYVFRRHLDREEFLARRYMIRIPAPHQRKSDAQFTHYRDDLQSLIDFFAKHGRLPVEDELENADDIVTAFGSLRRAFRVIETVTDRDEWLHLTERRRLDLLVYLALKHFDGSYKMTDLPVTTQRDIRSHYQSLKNAVTSAGKLLYSVGSLDHIGMACRSSTVGKLTPSALYVHIDALEYLPALLKVYEACARRLVGDVPGANLVKLHRDAKKVSYLTYPDFDTDPHPALIRSDLVDLVEQKLTTRKYPTSGNVPILHRKEEFLHKSDRRWGPFRELTKAEVEAGLYKDPSRIGYRDAWSEIVTQAGFNMSTYGR